MLLLGEEVERHGRIRARKLEEVSECVAGYGRVARELGAARVEVIVTAPGRQSANAEELVHLALAAGAPARVVSADEEGRLAYLGAVASCAEDHPRRSRSATWAAAPGKSWSERCEAGRRGCSRSTSAACG